MTAPRVLRNPSYNTLLVFLAALPQFREWAEAHPEKDPTLNFPGFDFDKIRKDVQLARGASVRTMWRSEVEQHMVLLNRNYLVSERPGRSTDDQNAYNAPPQGEAMFNRISDATVQGQKLIDFIQSPYGHEHWQELWVLAVLTSGLPCPEGTVSQKTSIPQASVAKARRKIQRGFLAKHRDGTEFRFQVDLEVSRVGKGPPSLKLPMAAFAPEAENLEDIFDNLDALPDPTVTEEPIVVVDPAAVAPPSQGDPEETLSDELEQTLQSHGLDGPDNGTPLLAPGMMVLTVTVKKEDEQALREDADERGVSLDLMVAKAMAAWADEARATMKTRKREAIREQLEVLQREQEERAAEVLRLQGLLDDPPPSTP